MDNDFDLEALIAERDDPLLSATPVVLLPSQQRQLELISHLAAYSELLIAVMGADGSGKTTLAKALVEQRLAPEETLFFNASPTFGIPALLQAIARQWQLSSLPEQRGSALDQLVQHGQTRYAEGGQLLVIIDQAEQLDADTLNGIANLALLMPQQLSFALFGLTGFDQALRSSPAHAPVHALHLEVLDEQESQQLASHFLGQTMSSAQVQAALAASQGCIGPMIALLEDQQRADREQHLTAGSTTQAPHAVIKKTGAAQKTSSAQKAPFPITHILGSTALVAILLMAYVYQRSEDSSPDESAVSVVSNEMVLVDEAIVAAERDQALAALLDSAEPHDFNFAHEIEAEADLSAEQAQANVLPEPSMPAVAAPAAMPPPVDSIVATPETPIEPPPAKQATSAPAIRLPFDGAALLSQRQGYVVQLLGVRDVKAAQQYRDRWQGEVGQRLYLYQTVHQGQPWFVVVAGVYDNEATARRAVQQYPARIKANSPWVRPITAVHDALM